MTEEQFKSLINAQTKKEFDVLFKKGVEYTQASKDKLINFKETAAYIQITTLQAWAVHFYKHITAIFSYIKREKTLSESIQDRILDARNYLLLLLAIIQEKEKTPKDARQLSLNFRKRKAASRRKKRLIDEPKGGKVPSTKEN